MFHSFLVICNKYEKFYCLANVIFLLTNSHGSTCCCLCGQKKLYMIVLLDNQISFLTGDQLYVEREKEEKSGHKKLQIDSHIS